MKIALIFMLLLGFIQAFCANSDVASNPKTPVQTPAANTNKENTMTDNQPNSDIQEVFQLTLDLPNLQKYFHEDKPGRKPLNIVKNVFANEKKVSLTKFGEPVKFIDEAGRDVPAFEFTSYTISGKEATVFFRYAIEGIKGKAEFKLNGKWEVVSSNISEA